LQAVPLPLDATLNGPTENSGQFLAESVNKLAISTFSVAICPVCTPALIILLGVAASLRSPFIGVVLLLAFAMGRAIPVALGAWSLGLVENLQVFARYRRMFETTAGLTLIASGLYLLNAYFFWIPALAG
jgi:cytochrome c-type biogenesis protein